MVRKTQQTDTQISGNRKIRLKESNTSASCFSRDGTVLATTPPEFPNGEADDYPGPFYHVNPRYQDWVRTEAFIGHQGKSKRRLLLRYAGSKTASCQLGDFEIVMLISSFIKTRRPVS